MPKSREPPMPDGAEVNQTAWDRPTRGLAVRESNHSISAQGTLRPDMRR
jgi:hypothetical protein